MLKRRGGRVCRFLLARWHRGWGRDSTERVGPGKGEDEHTQACYHLPSKHVGKVIDGKPGRDRGCSDRKAERSG